MKRKIVRQGHNAMTLTLPSEWIKENNVSAGDEVNVDIRDKELIIKRGSEGGIDKINFMMHGKGEYIHRHLNVLYKLGYDEIRIEFDSPAMVDKILEEIESMSGFEVVEQGEDFCILKNIATGLEKEFDNILRKIFLNIQYSGEKSLELIRKEDFERLESLRQLHRVNNRMCNFCQRMLKKEGYREHRKTMLVYSMVGGLEQIADYYRNLLDCLISAKNEKTKIKISKDVLEILEKANSIFDSYYSLFYSFDAEKLSELKESCLDNLDEINKRINGRNEIDGNFLLNLNLIIERTYHLCECLI